MNNNEIKSLIEDVQLAHNYEEDVIRVENGESQEYEFDTTEDLFNKLDK